MTNNINKDQHWNSNYKFDFSDLNNQIDNFLKKQKDSNMTTTQPAYTVVGDSESLYTFSYPTSTGPTNYEEKTFTSIPISRNIRGAEIVEHPPHYNHGKFECIDVIDDLKLNFNLGSVLKYLWRCGLKDDEITELEKAKWYLEREINVRKNKLKN